MDHKKTWTFGIQIENRTYKRHHLWHLCGISAYQGGFRRMLVFHPGTVFHTRHIYRTKPINHCIYITAEIPVSTYDTFQI